MAEEDEIDQADGDEAGGAENPGEGAGKKKLIIMAGGGVLVLALLGGGAMMFLGGDEPASEAEVSAEATGEPPGEESGAKAEGKEAGAEQPKVVEVADDDDEDGGLDFGETYAMKPFHLNLGNPLENHYIRLEIALEYTGGENHKAEIEKRLPQLRDAVIGVASRKTREFLLGPDGRDQLRREILTRVNRYMSKPVNSVFITDLIIE